MSISLPTSLSALNTLIDWFIPAEIAADREMRKQARLFLISHLFGPFTVVDDASTSKYGGTGLGLASSRKLCRLMGGEVVAESALGQGSVFTIVLPAAPLAQAAADPQLPASNCDIRSLAAGPPGLASARLEHLATVLAGKPQALHHTRTVNANA